MLVNNEIMFAIQSDLKISITFKVANILPMLVILIVSQHVHKKIKEFQHFHKRYIKLLLK